MRSFLNNDWDGVRVVKMQPNISVERLLTGEEGEAGSTRVELFTAVWVRSCIFSYSYFSS